MGCPCRSRKLSRKRDNKAKRNAVLLDQRRGLVYSQMIPTDDGDRLPNQTFEFDIRDDGLIYFAGFDATDRNTIYKAERIR